jgi:hypothetical protein
MRLQRILALLTVTLLTLPFVRIAEAQKNTKEQAEQSAQLNAQTQVPLFDSIEGVAKWACKVVNVFFTAAIILTIVFVLVAAINYITANGDPAKVKKGHQTLIWAAVGFAVALIAATVPDIVAMILGTTLGALPAGC